MSTSLLSVLTDSRVRKKSGAGPFLARMEAARVKPEKIERRTVCNGSHRVHCFGVFHINIL